MPLPDASDELPHENDIVYLAQLGGDGVTSWIRQFSDADLRATGLDSDANVHVLRTQNFAFNPQSSTVFEDRELYLEKYDSSGELAAPGVKLNPDVLYQRADQVRTDGAGDSY